METSLSIIFFVLTIILLLLLLKNIFNKVLLHFKLLKLLYPKKLQGVDSYLGLMWITNYFKLDFGTMVWLSVPFYYSKIKREDIPALALHEKLLLINKKIVIFLILLVINIASLSTIAFLLKG